MAYEGLGEMFKSDSADMCAENIPLVSIGGLSGGSSVRRLMSEGPQFFNFLFNGKSLSKLDILVWYEIFSLSKHKMCTCL